MGDCFKLFWLFQKIWTFNKPTNSLLTIPAILFFSFTQQFWILLSWLKCLWFLQNLKMTPNFRLWHIFVTLSSSPQTSNSSDSLTGSTPPQNYGWKIKDILFMYAHILPSTANKLSKVLEFLFSHIQLFWLGHHLLKKTI